MTLIRRLLPAFVLLLASLGTADAQSRGPLRIEITEGVIEPLPLALPPFVAENAAAEEIAAEITRVIAGNLTGTGLFREIPREAHIARITRFDAPVQFADWKAINAQGLVTGAVAVEGRGRVTVKFRLYDVFAEAELGEGLQLAGTRDTWRRIAHKVSDAVYSRITGEGGYFDSEVVFVAETGPKDARVKRLAIMDQDGANLRYLTGGSELVLAPRFSPSGDRILYTSYATGFPQVSILDLGSGRSRALDAAEVGMSFAPRFAPDGRGVIYSRAVGGNSDLFTFQLASGSQARLTASAAIETSPSYSPDGSRVVFESDRSGTQQLYVMPAGGGEARRISFGEGRYATPVWSPRGDLIAFTKQTRGRFHIGVMRTDGSEERLLTASFLDEGPTWSPNGRVIMFTRSTQGAGGEPALYSVDVTGRNLKRVPTPGAASDPAWSPLRP